MQDVTTSEDVLKFIQLRPAKAVAPERQISLFGETPFATELQRSEPASRSELANKVLREQSASVADFIASPLQQKLLTLACEVRSQNGSFGDLLGVIQSRGRFPESQDAARQLESKKQEFSDVLLASKFGSAARPAVLPSLEMLYRLSYLMSGKSGESADSKVSAVLDRPIVLPAGLFASAALQPVNGTGRPVLALKAGPITHRTDVSQVQPSGIAQLLVLKQHLLRYERTDIAHVENVMIGEKRSRTYRTLDRNEEVLTLDSQTTEERQTELQTAERFMMNRETAKTVKLDEKFGFGLSVSGKYGPMVEFSTNAKADINIVEEESTKSATNYAKDVTARTLAKVVQSVREQRVTTLLKEVEETNLHQMKNSTGEHVNGMYQFLDKVYQSQVFDYGLRQMFDFMIPEPASWIWHLENSSQTNSKQPDRPPRLEDFAPSAASIHASNYQELAAKFGATGITPPPPQYLSASATLKHGEDNADENGQPRSIMAAEVAIPRGYLPYSAIVVPMAVTDNPANPLRLVVTVGKTRLVWEPGDGEFLKRSNDPYCIAHTQQEIALYPNNWAHPEQDKIPIEVLAYESALYSVNVDTIFQRTPEELDAWRLKVWEALAAAARDSLTKYEQKIEELNAAAEAKAYEQQAVGTSPSQNLKIITTELKKQCIASMTRQNFEGFGAMLPVGADQSAPAPVFDFDKAVFQGSYIRFFEQAFEWDQMQFAFYPYFWAAPPTRAARFLRQEVDPVFLDFLQAGSGRVVVPVRPGFEVAVTHFLETGEIWNGAGDPPDITSSLYLPIITELKDRANSPKGEIPVGEPWETRMPTPLVVLRREPALPAWERADPAGWTWRESA
jgi:hypothetical protein